VNVALGIEAPDGRDQPDRAFLEKIADGMPVAAVAPGDMKDEAKRPTIRREAAAASPAVARLARSTSSARDNRGSRLILSMPDPVDEGGAAAERHRGRIPIRAGARSHSPTGRSSMPRDRVLFGPALG